ncbi:sigma factor-like helix-turn-helix DNA-binding protein [Candidatus Palauibacter sp.]|uniref:sigma factor-like helix-turn-helix DNA-binding protein n=1 Tax=Candidatus Palauibacter sp. TaxID=3101350 RepID=UPI003B02AFAB
MLEVVNVPAGIRHTPIIATDLSARTRNLLFRNGLRTIGELDGLSTADLLWLDQIGPRAATEIVDYFRHLATIGATRETFQGDTPTIAGLPPHLAPVPISSLALNRVTVAVLDQWGCHTLGDLRDWDLARVLSPAQLAKLGGLVDVLRTIPMDKLAEMSWAEPGGVGVPALGAELLRSIASAKTLDEEVAALCANLGDRNRELVLARLRYRSERRPTLDELAEAAGVSRERVRQIVTGHLRRLATSGLRLPIASRVVREIDLAGGIASTAVLVERLSAEGILPDRLSVSPLAELSDAGLVPQTGWDPEIRVWVGVEGHSAWIETGRLGDVVGRLKGKVRDDLRRVGAVNEPALEKLSPFDAGHAATLVTLRGKSYSRVLGYLVPKPSSDSSMVRRVRKMLAVTTPLPMVELHSGLLRSPGLDPVPPRDVVESVLKQHPGFEVAGGLARLSGKPPRSEVLSKSERALVEVIEEHQGIILLREMVDGMKMRGLSQAMTATLTRSPILSRVSTAVYALRGRRVPDHLLSARRKEWLDSRST